MGDPALMRIRSKVQRTEKRLFPSFTRVLSKMMMYRRFGSGRALPEELEIRLAITAGDGRTMVENSRVDFFTRKRDGFDCDEGTIQCCQNGLKV
jgi:hypothetical protein